MHLKRLKTPSSWNIRRKEKKFTTVPQPRGKTENVLTLNVLLRDVLKIAKNTKEVKFILNSRKVLVNGKARTSVRFPVNVFDVVEIPDLKKTYQIVFNEYGKISAQEIKNKGFRLARIENKTAVKGGKIQLNLFDGSNIIADKQTYKIGDVLMLSLKDNSVKGTLGLKKGAKVLILKGAHRGKRAEIENIIDNIKPKEVELKSGEAKIRTRLDNVYVVEK